jgi:2-polyprenyl-6-hydroxyphenyl methylase/3-demethylubiquinone-9 3-methyltransferase
MKKPRARDDWSPEVRRVYEHDLQEMGDRSIAPHVWNSYHGQLQMYFRIVRRLRPTSILDVGCAQGTLALLLAEQGFTVCANDLRPSFLDYAKSRHERGDIRFLPGNIFDLEPQPEFDLLFANQIIEHLVHPTRFLRHLRKFLRPGGHAVVTTPNHDYVRNSLPSHGELGDPGAFEDRQFTADGDGHFFAYTKAELVRYFSESGLTGIHPFYFETPWISGHMKVRHLHRYVPYEVLRRLDGVTRGVPGIRRFLCHQLGVIGRNP